MGAFLFLAAVAVFTPVGWDQIPVVAKLLVAAAGACLVVGYAVVKLREAARQISQVKAREEVARTLHHRVLRTLGIVQRRATDPDLSMLAREQERGLRELLLAMEPAEADSGEDATISSA